MFVHLTEIFAGKAVRFLQFTKVFDACGVIL